MALRHIPLGGPTEVHPGITGRALLGGMLYLAGSIGGLALYDAHEGFYGCAGLILGTSLGVGALSTSRLLLHLPIALIPIGLAFGFPETGYEPSPGFAVGVILMLPSVAAVGVGRWIAGPLHRRDRRPERT